MSFKTILKAITPLLVVTSLLPYLSFANMPAPNTYSLSARLTLKNEKKTVSGALPFLWAKYRITPANNGKGWIEKEGGFVWIPGREKHVLEIPLEISKLNDGSTDRLAFPCDFNELWIEYKDVNPQNPSDVTISLDLHPITELTHRAGEGQINYVTAIGGEVKLQPTEIIDVAGSDWKEKDIFYSFKRESGLSFDDSWRFVQDKERSVIRRRFHKDLSTFDAIDFEFSNGTEVKAVNMRLGFKDGSRPDVTLLWDALPKDIITDGDITIVRIWLGRYVRKNYSGAKKAFLEELIIHLYGQLGQVVRDRPFKRLVFQDYENSMAEIYDEEETYTGNKQNTEKKGIKIMRLPTQTDELNSKIKRIKVDIGELSDVYANHRETALKSVLLKVKPSGYDDYGGIWLEGIWALSNSDNKRTEVLNAIDNISQGFGGPFLSLSSDNDHVEALKFLGYYSFNKSNDRKIFSQKYPLGEESLVSNNDLLQDDRDVKIVANRIPLSNNERAVEGDREHWLEILWSIDTIIKEDTRFLLRLSNGDEFVRYGLMTIKSNSGDEFRRVFEPNKVLDLAGINGRITGIRLRMELEGGQSVIKLEDMALFRPVSLPLVEALKIPYPIYVYEPLNPEINSKSGDIDASRGRLKGVVWRQRRGSDYAGSLEWNTKVDNQTGIRSVHFSFENSKTINAENPCWLSLTFIGERQRVSRDICRGSQNGDVNIPVPDIFSDGGVDKLLLITWKADMGRQIVDNSHSLVFDFQMYVERLVWQSISEEMLKSPIFSVGGNKFYPKEGNADFTAQLLSGGAWFDMGTIDSDNLTNDIRVVDNPYLQVTSVIAERVLPVGQLYMPEFKDKEKVLTSQWPKRLAKTGLFVLILAVLVHVWRKGWWQKLWQMIKYFIGFILGYLRIIRENTWAKLLPGNLYKMIFWIILSVLLYFIGLKTGGTGTNISFFTFGGLSGFLALRSLLWLVRPWITRRWSAAAKRIYEERGKVYFLGFMATIIGCAVSLVLNSEIVAEQLAVIGYYCIAAGVVQNAWQMKKEAESVNGD
ncbi:MAG: hypothetical protein HQK94_18625 [Nitrospirae bacterium]|nr:hypothetical protein [Nitrospirota bacterium]